MHLKTNKPANHPSRKHFFQSIVILLPHVPPVSLKYIYIKILCKSGHSCINNKNTGEVDYHIPFNFKKSMI